MWMMHCCGRKMLFATAGVLYSSAGSRIRHILVSRSLREKGKTGRSTLLSPSTAAASSAASAGVSAAAGAAEGVDFFVTLERSSDIEAGDEAVWQSGVFDAEVHPDLPPAWTTAGLLSHYLRRAREAVLDTNRHRTSSTSRSSGSSTGSSGAGTVGRAADCSSRSTRDKQAGSYLVRTVPVQVSRKKDLRRRLAAAAGVDSEGFKVQGGRPADALLLVSGSHPGRRLPFAGSVLPDVYDELRLATSMRNSGLLPQRLAFWAVANPMTEGDEAGADRVRKKVELGAEVILTQPPLVWEPFELWLRGVHTSGALTGGPPVRDGGEERAGVKKATVTTVATTTTTTPSMPQSALDRRYPPLSAAAGRAGGAVLLVGLPVITSPKGLRLWLDLCGVGSDPNICRRAFEAFGNSPPTRLTRQSQQQRLEEREDTASAAGEASGMVGSGKPSSPASAGEHAHESPSPYGQAWLETTLSNLKSLNEMGVAGVHVMAPGRGPRRRARELASGGVFGPPRRGQQG